VTDPTGNPIPNISVSFTIIQQPTGSIGSLSGANIITGTNGIASSELTLGQAPGQYQVTAFCQSANCAPSSVLFTERTPFVATLLDPVPLTLLDTSLLDGSSISKDTHLVATSG